MGGFLGVERSRDRPHCIMGIPVPVTENQCKALIGKAVWLPRKDMVINLYADGILIRNNFALKRVRKLKIGKKGINQAFSTLCVGL